MGFYVTITVATLVVAGLTLKLWQKTHCLAFVLGSAFMYYWSLWGAWVVISSGGQVDTYLYHKMFPVALDQDYFLTLVLYTLFIATVQVTVLWRTKPVRVKPPAEPLSISHYRMIVVSAFTAILAYLLVRDTISLGTEVTGSGYTAIRDAPMFTIYQILLNFGMLPLSIGFAVFLCGKDAKHLVGKSTIITFVGYAVVLGGQLAFCIMVGNRAEVMACFVAMGLFYLANAKKPRRILAAGVGSCAAITLFAVKAWRDGTLFSFGSGGLWPMLSDFVENFTKSAEVLAAHFSMYGALHKHLPLTWGTSFVSLICSVIPRALWADRPDPIYFYYSKSVGAIEGQGYTIHHGTGWYLNFSVPGMLVGALVLGAFWARLYNLFENADRREGISRLYAITAFWTLTGGIPAILREGPEIYKQIAIDYSLVPLLMLGFACSSVVLRENRPSLAIARPIRDAGRAVASGR